MEGERTASRFASAARGTLAFHKTSVIARQCRNGILPFLNGGTPFPHYPPSLRGNVETASCRFETAGRRFHIILLYCEGTINVHVCRTDPETYPALIVFTLPFLLLFCGFGILFPFSPLFEFGVFNPSSGDVFMPEGFAGIVLFELVAQLFLPI